MTLQTSPMMNEQSTAQSIKSNNQSTKKTIDLSWRCKSGQQFNQSINNPIKQSIYHDAANLANNSINQSINQ